MMAVDRTIAVRIWDLPTRIFHWTLVLGIGFMWLSAELGGLWMDWHERVGVFLLALIVFRIVWGFVGSETARFSQFLRAPWQALSHWRELGQASTAYHVGHNPLGAWMVVALLALVLAQALTGLFANDDILVEGPLYNWVSSALSKELTGWHKLLFNLLLLAVLLHVLAIAFYKVRKNTNLLKAMLVGSADWPERDPIPAALDFVSPWKALVLFSVIYALIHFGLQWMAGLV